MESRVRILVPCMDWDRPAGGVRKIYRHVDVLNAAGIEAAVMHQQPGFRCRWFENQTRVMSYDQLGQPRPGDAFMVPEILAWQFVTLWPGVPKVVFNQNAYQTFSWRTAGHNVNPYIHPDFRAVIVVSEDSAAYMKYAFPNQNVFRIRYSIDPGVFYFGAEKKKCIAYMPRKKEKDAKQVLAILKYRGGLSGWEVVAIQDKSEAETAQILRESAIFLSLSTQEGWGLPPMEAMACGCVVVGYDGRGGAEYLKEPYARVIEPEDVAGFAAAVEGAMRDVETNPKAVWDRTKVGSQFVLRNYAPGIEADDVVRIWERILALRPSKAR